MGFFCVMDMEPGSTARVGFGNNERHGVEAIFVAIQSVGIFSRCSIEMTELIEAEDVIVGIMCLSRGIGKFFLRRLKSR